MNAFRFDRVKHEYWLDDRRLPSVSEIISPLVDYSMVPEDRLAFARDRGTAVHLACHLDDINDLREETVDPVNVMPFLQAWRKCKDELEIEVEGSEEPLYDNVFMFAGTPDKRVTARRASRKRIKVAVDLKTVAKMSPVTGVQLAGYEILTKRSFSWSPDERWGVQLRADRTYKLEVYPGEQPMFLSLLNFWKWRARYGN